MGIARPSRPCRAPGCPDLAATGYAYCMHHYRHTNREHNRKWAVYQSREYRNQRARFLAAYPECFLDLAPTDCAGVLTIHHINHDAHDQRWENFATACHHHHLQLEREYQLGRVDGPLHAALVVALASRQD